MTRQELDKKLDVALARAVEEQGYIVGLMKDTMGSAQAEQARFLLRADLGYQNAIDALELAINVEEDLTDEEEALLAAARATLAKS